ncbi:DUF5655 domain-containing protein [Amycolatopsis palatopharyngis]|uniref:DUF5655 domain-containing protein n=1 Tax=Amycolatopsis palatopharyngis TaxID=187982 RepID=UPI000E250A73|nr:DUF5655 domain-containing protein [Amycolatopsis palatopharyngis]
MSQTKDWRERWQQSAELLERKTGAGVKEWNRRVVDTGIGTESELKKWLKEQGVTGFAQTLLVRERFGYPEYTTASADELVEGQYAGKESLRPIYDRLIAVAADVGEVTLQVRKSYVSLMTPKRKFAVVKASTKTRVDLGMRIEDVEPHGRLESAQVMRDESSTVRIPLTSESDVDDEVADWLAKAYQANS